MQYHPNLFLYHGIVADCYKSIFVKLTSRAAPRKSWGVHPLVMTVNYLTTLTENRRSATVGRRERGSASDKAKHRFQS